VKVDQLVFLDEFGATTHMTRSHARGPRGKRVVCKNPAGHWKVLSTIAAMTVRGMISCGIFEGATDTDAFATFLREGLLPAMKPGQVLVLDNLSVHRTAAAQKLLEVAGVRVLYLPAYSPDYNPIEMAISKVKSVLKKLGERTVDGLFAAIGTALKAITQEDATNFVRHCGYRAMDG
jgi:transposase